MVLFESADFDFDAQLFFESDEELSATAKLNSNKNGQNPDKLVSIEAQAKRSNSSYTNQINSAKRREKIIN